MRTKSNSLFSRVFLLLIATLFVLTSAGTTVLLHSNRVYAAGSSSCSIISDPIISGLTHSVVFNNTLPAVNINIPIKTVRPNLRYCLIAYK